MVTPGGSAPCWLRFSAASCAARSSVHSVIVIPVPSTAASQQPLTKPGRCRRSGITRSVRTSRASPSLSSSTLMKLTLACMEASCSQRSYASLRKREPAGEGNVDPPDRVLPVENLVRGRDRMPTFRDLLAQAKSDIREVDTAEAARLLAEKPGSLVLDVREADE